MSIPTSLIVVLLVVAWLVVLVPMVAKRRDKVPRSESGGQGFRVLRRAQATLKRRPKRTTKADGEPSADPAPAEASSTVRERTLVPVGAAADQRPQDAAEEWAAAHAGRAGQVPANRGRVADADEAVEPADGSPQGSWPAWPAPRPADTGYDESPTAEHRFPAPDDVAGQAGLWADGSDPTARPEAPESSVTEFPYAQAPRIPNEVDEQEWTEHAAAASAPARGYQVDDEALRPTPRRRGRGGYDPEAAEATRAYKYRQRRRVTLALTAAFVLFSVVAVLLASWLWVGAAVSAVLLAMYLMYLRRQVKIEAQIRQRRMERLQRARQIRPEYGRGRPPARATRSAAGPGRTVVDLDDDDPTFDHLDPYDPPVTYRRAAGQ
ncbi:gephyrin-like molybdotransferase receptor GlpR [Nakamurella sp.]|uniref:divisome protein SepX/GlpR n=1 Tax=Nakamurella sp. TaxID=1869182 RepID=UPI003783AE82